MAESGNIVSLSNISFKTERLGMFINRCVPRGLEWKCHFSPA